MSEVFESPTGELETTSNDPKLKYVITQINEMGSIIRRNEVDIFINQDIKWLPYEQEGVDTQLKTLEKENEKLHKAVASLKKLKAQLEA